MSIFSAFKKEELCQLYIYPSTPDITFCKSYFRITDKDVLYSFFKFHVCNNIFNDSNINTSEHRSFDNPNDEKIYRNSYSHKPLIEILRDTMWKMSRWYNKQLEEWIKEQNPKVIFLAPGKSKFLYNIALKISQKFDLPIIFYICDDYYFVKKTKKIVSKIQTKLLQKKIKETAIKSKLIVTISNELEKNYEKINKSIMTIMTGTNYSISGCVRDISNRNNIVYMGNVGCNRHLSLIEIGEALNSINDKYKRNYKLEIYSEKVDKNVIALFEKCKSIEYKGFICGEEFEIKIRNSKILCHVESFCSESIDIVKNSISTKISDSLGSGNCFFAYGPKGVASIKYLISNNCAVVATSNNELEKKLLVLFENDEFVKKKIENALLVAHRNHDSEKSSNAIYQEVNSIYENHTNK